MELVERHFDRGRALLGRLAAKTTSVELNYGSGATAVLSPLDLAAALAHIREDGVGSVPDRLGQCLLLFLYVQDQTVATELTARAAGKLMEWGKGRKPDRRYGWSQKMQPDTVRRLVVTALAEMTGAAPPPRPTRDDPRATHCVKCSAEGWVLGVPEGETEAFRVTCPHCRGRGRPEWLAADRAWFSRVKEPNWQRYTVAYLEVQGFLMYREAASLGRVVAALR